MLNTTGFDTPGCARSHQPGEAAEDGAGVAPLAVLDEAELPDPLVDVEYPRELPEAPDLLHSHYYEGPEEAEGVPGWPAWSGGVEAFPCLCFGNA